MKVQVGYLPVKNISSSLVRGMYPKNFITNLKGINSHLRVVSIVIMCAYDNGFTKRINYQNVIQNDISMRNLDIGARV